MDMEKLTNAVEREYVRLKDIKKREADEEVKKSFSTNRAHIAKQLEQLSGLAPRPKEIKEDFPPVTVATSIPKTESGLAKNGGLMVHPDKQATIDQKDDNVDIEIRNSAEFSSLAEDIFENAIANLLCEANLGEVNLTARPRTIALPPSRGKKTR